MSHYNNPEYNVWLKSGSIFVGCDGWTNENNIHTILDYISPNSIEYWCRHFNATITDVYVKPHFNIFIHAEISRKKF